ncbi:MAG: hypothetical protein NTV30_05380 [Chloroflexi bacterium]|nr:hypothetical protein [Chloroflexota bacterium]
MKKFLMRTIGILVLSVCMIFTMITPVSAEDTATKVVFITAVQSNIVAGQVSTVMTVQIQSAANSPFKVTADTTISLSSTSYGTLFDKTTNGTFDGTVTSIVIPKDSNSIDFYVKDTVAGTKTITAASTGLTSATQDIVIIPATISKISFTTPVPNFNPGKISGVITVQTQDAYNNPVNTLADTVIALTSSSSNGKFDIEASGLFNGTITSVTVAQGSNTASFYYTDTTVGYSTITAASAGLASGTHYAGIAGPVKDITFSNSELSNIEAGKASDKITIIARDSSGITAEAGSNIKINLIATSEKGKFDTNSSGAFDGSINSVIILAGTSSIDFYYKDTIAGAITILASSTGYKSISQNETVIAGPGKQIVFTSAPQLKMKPDVVSGPIIMRVRDEYGNDASLVSDTIFTLESTSPTGRFSLDASGAFDGSITSVTLTTGGTASTFYYKDSNGGDVTLTVSATDFSVITQAAAIVTTINIWVIIGPILFIVVALIAYQFIAKPIIRKRRVKQSKVIKTKPHTRVH